MRNEKEIVLSSETHEADHARRRLMFRISVVFVVLTAIGVFLFSQYSRVTETTTGQEGLIWGIILILSFEAILITLYVVLAYTPIFKVMPKGEMGSLTNWGKKSGKKSKNIS